MPNLERWPDRMSAADALHWSLGGIRGFRSTVAIVLEFRRPLVATRVRSELVRLTERLPRMRERVVAVPLDLAPPEWVEDHSFDVDRHLQRRAVSPPGDASCLSTALNQILAAPLPRHRPPWNATLLSGLAHGRSVLVLKFHYAMADGGGLARFLRALDEKPSAYPAPRFSVTPRFIHRDALLWRALQYNLEEGSEAVSIARAIAESAARDPARALAQVRRFAASAVNAVSDAVTPRASDAGRTARMASRRLSLQTTTLTGFAFRTGGGDASVHAIIATIVSAALHAIRPAQRRSAFAVDIVLPIAVRERAMAVDLTLEPEEPESPSILARLQSVQRQLRAADPEPRLLLYALGARIAGALPAPLVQAVGRERTRALPALHLPCCGPSAALQFAGQAVAAIYPFAPLLGEPPAVIAAHWYRDKLYLGIDFDPHRLPGIEDLASATAAAWSELRPALRHLSAAG